MALISGTKKKKQIIQNDVKQSKPKNLLLAAVFALFCWPLKFDTFYLKGTRRWVIALFFTYVMSPLIIYVLIGIIEKVISYLPYVPVEVYYLPKIQLTLYIWLITGTIFGIIKMIHYLRLWIWLGLWRKSRGILKQTYNKLHNSILKFYTKFRRQRRTKNKLKKNKLLGQEISKKQNTL